MNTWFEVFALITGMLQLFTTLAEWVRARRVHRRRAGTMVATSSRSGRHDQGMHVRVDRSGVSLVDGETFREFAVVVEGEDVDLSGVLTGLGVVDADGEHVSLDTQAVKGLAVSIAAAERAAQFDGMIEFARSKGWVDHAGRMRAHIERR